MSFKNLPIIGFAILNLGLDRTSLYSFNMPSLKMGIILFLLSRIIEITLKGIESVSLSSDFTERNADTITFVSIYSITLQFSFL